MCCHLETSDIINICIALATFLAAVIALFGEHWRKCLFQPKLTLKMKDELGELNKTVEGIDARYFHIVVANKTKESAHNACVLLTQLDESYEGNRRTLWKGEIPLKWMYHKVYHTFVRDIGSPQKCDLFMLTQKSLAIQVLFETGNLRTVWEKCDLYLMLSVKSDELMSKPITVRVIWDGKWSTDDGEMAKHLTVKQI
ncbi:MAG: hypothetical protein IJV40_14575 [Oscillospiraceae bacterium]|nr:hypothetical protein [Oscillospiraceae bacterium]